MDNRTTSAEKIKPPPQFSDVNTIQPVPRLIHPKKRKFDATEFEDKDLVPTSSAVAFKNGNSLDPPPLSVSCSLQSRIVENTGAIIAVTPSPLLITDAKSISNGQQQDNTLLLNSKKYMKVQNQGTVTPISSIQLGPQISYQPICVRSSTSTIQGNSGRIGQHNTGVIGQSQVLNEEDIIDLSEWCNHRILAKRRDHYASGVIRSCDSKDKIHVEFDPPEGGSQIYENIFNLGRFDIVSDASPSISDVST